MKSTLTLIQGGRDWRTEEMHAELVVSRGERLTFASQVRHHALWASHSLATGVGDAGRHMNTLLRLAAQEEARAGAIDDSERVA